MSKPETIDSAVEELIRLADDTPGLEVEFDPLDAERSGAFVEDALSYEEAVAGSIDRLTSRQLI